MVGLRDRALLSVMVFSFARVSAAVGMRRQDYFRQGLRGWLRLHEKGGKRHDVPPAPPGRERPAEAGLVKGKTVGVDATTLEANAAMRSIKRRDTRKRVLIQAAGCNLELLLRCLTGVGKPQSLQGWALSAVCELIGRLIDRWGRLTDSWGAEWRPAAFVGSIAHRHAA